MFSAVQEVKMMLCYTADSHRQNYRRLASLYKKVEYITPVNRAQQNHLNGIDMITVRSILLVTISVYI